MVVCWGGVARFEPGWRLLILHNVSLLYRIGFACLLLWFGREGRGGVIKGPRAGHVGHVYGEHNRYEELLFFNIEIKHQVERERGKGTPTLMSVRQDLLAWSQDMQTPTFKSIDPFDSLSWHRRYHPHPPTSSLKTTPKKVLFLKSKTFCRFSLFRQPSHQLVVRRRMAMRRISQRNRHSLTSVMKG